MRLKLDSMEALYLEQLADLLNAEKQLVQALPKALEKASTPELKDLIAGHLEETRGHAARIERIFSDLGEKPKSVKCAAMQGLIDEAGEVLKADGDPAVKDAAIIACAQRIEHYEIAGYGCAKTFARILGRHQDAEELQATLDEEHRADHRLTEVAEASINQKAMH